MDDAGTSVRRDRRSEVQCGPHPIDVLVGRRIRSRRTLLGLNQTELGNALGLSYQQVQRYEHGTNRVSASRLFEFSRVLDVPVLYFFEEMPAETVDAVSHNLPVQTSDAADADEFSPLTERETFEFVRAYRKITESRLRKSVYDLVIALGSADTD